MIEIKWEGFSYLGGGVLNRNLLELGKGIEHDGVGVTIILIILIQDNRFPFLGRIPPRRRCSFTKLG